MAVVAALNLSCRVANLGELLALLDGGGVPRFERRNRRIDACIVSSHVGHIVGRQRLGDRRHDVALPDARGEVAQLPGKIIGRLAVDTRKRAVGVRAATDGVALYAGGSTGSGALRRDGRAVLRGGLARLVLRLRPCAETERGEHGRGRRRESQATGRPACTRGPGDFRYLVLIASSAHKVRAPIVIV